MRTGSNCIGISRGIAGPSTGTVGWRCSRGRWIWERSSRPPRPAEPVESAVHHRSLARDQRVGAGWPVSKSPQPSVDRGRVMSRAVKRLQVASHGVERDARSRNTVVARGARSGDRRPIDRPTSGASGFNRSLADAPTTDDAGNNATAMGYCETDGPDESVKPGRVPPTWWCRVLQ